MTLPYAEVTVRLDHLTLDVTLDEAYTAAHYALTYEHLGELTDLSELIARLSKPDGRSSKPDDDSTEQLAAAQIEMGLLSRVVVGPPTLRPPMVAWASVRLAVVRDPRWVWSSGRIQPIALDALQVQLARHARLYLGEDEAIDLAVGVFVDRGDAGTIRVLRLRVRLPACGELPDGETPLLEHDDGGRIEGAITVRRLRPAEPGGPSLARTPPETSAPINRNSIEASPPLVIRITRIDGLYRPYPEARVEGGHSMLAGAVNGYVSDDDQGRIYTSRTPDGAWRANTQFIELQAEATLVGMTAPLEAVAERLPRLRWSIEEVADPSVQDLTFHREAASVVGQDNAGFADADRAQRVQWQLDDGPRTDGATMDTPLAWQHRDGHTVGRAVVRLHCPDVAGDRFRVHAMLPEAHGFPGALFTDSTGVMTMWKRVFVDYFRMAGARRLPLQDLPVPFQDACIELVVREAQVIEDRDPVWDSDDTSVVEARVLDYVNEVFQPQPGRLCLIAARRPCRLPGGSDDEPALHRLGGRLRHDVHLEVRSGHSGWFSLAYLEVERDFAEEVNMVSLLLDNQTYVSLTMQILRIERVDGRTRFWLAGDDLAAAFDGSLSDGSLARSSLGTRRFFPGRWAEAPTDDRGNLEDLRNVQAHEGGYPVTAPDEVRFMVWQEGGVNMPSAMSPTVEHAGRLTFAGRTICFTSDDQFSDDTMALRVIVHELTHAFGMPHKCGRYDRRTPRLATCAMNYPGHWMIDPSGDVAPRPPGLRDDFFLCAEHIRALRRVKLERNGALGWGGERV